MRRFQVLIGGALRRYPLGYMGYNGRVERGYTLVTWDSTALLARDAKHSSNSWTLTRIGCMPSPYRVFTPGMRMDNFLAALRRLGYTGGSEAWMIILLTGDRGSGKTSLCQRWAHQARAAGWDVAGLLSPAVFNQGLKVAIDALDLRSGERRRLAWMRTDATSAEELGTPAWCFDPATITWGNQVLACATPCDLLIVDELGPLELERGHGWTAGIDAVNTNCYRQAWVVVRREMLSAAQQLWPTAHVVEVSDAYRWNWPSGPEQ